MAKSEVRRERHEVHASQMVKQSVFVKRDLRRKDTYQIKVSSTHKKEGTPKKRKREEQSVLHSRHERISERNTAPTALPFHTVSNTPPKDRQKMVTLPMLKAYM